MKRLFFALMGLILLAGSLALLWMAISTIFEARGSGQLDLVYSMAIMLLASVFGLVGSVRIFQAAIDD